MEASKPPDSEAAHEKPAKMSKRISFIAHGGKVQGVSFRYYTKKEAQSLNLTGWVRNIPNEKVEGQAQGPEEALQTLLKFIDKGPRGAHVVKLEKKEIELVEGEEGFETLKTVRKGGEARWD